MVALLTRWRCDHSVSQEGLTPLHWAADRGHSDCVRLLLSSGADPHSPTVASSMFFRETFARIHSVKFLNVLNLKGVEFLEPARSTGLSHGT